MNSIARGAAPQIIDAAASIICKTCLLREGFIGSIQGVDFVIIAQIKGFCIVFRHFLGEVFQFANNDTQELLVVVTDY